MYERGVCFGPPTEEISAIQAGGHLKNALNLYRMSGEVEMGIVNFLLGGGGGGYFLAQP